MNKIILYIATSLDGFIADINGGVDWLPHPKDDAELEAVGYKSLMSRIDTILMGSRSYKQIWALLQILVLSKFSLILVYSSRQEDSL